MTDRQVKSDRTESRWTPVRNGSQVDIQTADGATISIDNTDPEGGDILLAIDLGEGRDGVFVRLSPAVAAYLAGQLATRAGVILG